MPAVTEAIPVEFLAKSDFTAQLDRLYVKAIPVRKTLHTVVITVNPN